MAQQNINMTREELKQLWLSIPTDPNKKQENTIVVEMGNSKFWPGYGTVKITRDGPSGFSEFTTHQEFPMKYALETEEYKSGEYQLVIK